jgi:hypothetical protein
MELHALNRRLGNVEFISHPADEKYHAELCAQVRDLGGTPIPSNHSYAWRRTYEAYEELLRHPPKVVAPVQHIDRQRIWRDAAKELKDARSYLKSIAGRTGLGEERCLELLGLKAEDFERMPDTVDEMFMLYRRVQPVYEKLRPMTDAQIENYFLEKRVHQLETRLAALEAAK